MSHRVGYRKLGRKTEHRIATLRNLAAALFEHERIETTLFKAKELRPFAEKMITRARQDSVHARRLIFAQLRNRKLVETLFETIAPRCMSRPGGYTRIIRTGPRRGDAAEMAIIELVERSVKEKKAAPAKDEKKGLAAGLKDKLTGKKTAGKGDKPEAAE